MNANAWFDAAATHANAEIKARVASLDAPRAIARRLATATLDTFRQVDTYFHVPRGRLKLREATGAIAQLVWYERADTAGPRTSQYRLVEVVDAAGIKALLADALPQLAVVDKRREVYLHHNVRIHLDEVESLGTFVEFEAVLSATLDAAHGREQVERLLGEFGVPREDLIPVSYADLIQRAAQGAAVDAPLSAGARFEKKS